MGIKGIILSAQATVGTLNAGVCCGLAEAGLDGKKAPSCLQWAVEGPPLCSCSPGPHPTFQAASLSLAGEAFDNPTPWLTPNREQLRDMFISF